MNAFLWFFSLYQPVTKNWIQNKQSNVFAVISIWIVFFSFGIKMTLNNVCWHLVFRIWCLVTGRSNEKNVSYQIFFRNKPAVDPNLVHYFWCHFRYLLWSILTMVRIWWWFNIAHTVILLDWTFKKWGHSNFAFQHC